jgi:hypothetical protein
MAHQLVREPFRAEEADRLANACQTVEEKLIVWIRSSACVGRIVPWPGRADGFAPT